MRESTMQALTMKPKEAASVTGLSTRTITRMCESGKLEAAKLGKSWLINRAALMRKLGIEGDGDGLC